MTLIVIMYLSLCLKLTAIREDLLHKMGLYKRKIFLDRNLSILCFRSAYDNVVVNKVTTGAMMPEDLRAGLVKIGLSELEAKVYLALLGHYKLSAKELSRNTGIFRTQIYDVLKTLIKKGFCTELLDNVKKYIAVDPEIAIESIIIDLEKRGTLALSLSRQLHQEFLSSHYEDDNSGKFIEVLHSTRAVRKRLRRYLDSTSKVILSFNKPPFPMRYRDSGKDLLMCDQQHITHKSIFQIDSENPHDSLLVAKKFKNSGEDVRISEFLPMKMMIFDNLRVYYQLSGDIQNSVQATSTFIQHPEITLALINSFWVEWEKSFSIENYEKMLNDIEN